MQITSLSLRNFRVFASLDLELPPGLVGVYGPNGSGKSSLLEAILWALYGRARTGKAEIRTTGSSGECSVELAFVHEDHQYLVRRSISGVNSTVKARVEIGGQTVADGPTEVGRFLRSTLGMEEAAFRSSVFAEQKQLSAFSDATPETRRRLVLQLLGITPIEKARDAARADTRTKRSDHERLLALLPDVGALDERLRLAEQARSESFDHFERAATSQHVAEAAMAEVDASVRQLESVRSAHELVTQKGKAARAERDRAAIALERLSRVSGELRSVASQLEEIGPGRSPEALENDQTRVTLLERYEEAERSLRRVPAAVTNDAGVSLRQQMHHLEAEVSELRHAASAAAGELAAAAAAVTSAALGATRAKDSMSRSSTLTAEADCPLCGQALGQGFAAVLAHRTTELESALSALHRAEVAEQSARSAASEKMLAKVKREAELKRLRSEVEQSAVASATRTAAEERVQYCAEALESFGGPGQPGERSRLEKQLADERRQDTTRTVLLTQLEQLPRIQRELDGEGLALDIAEKARAALRVELDGLNFDARQFDILEEKRREAGSTLAQAANSRDNAASASAKAEQEVASVTALVMQAQLQHGQATQLAEEVRYIGRSADLLHGFRQQVVAAIGPRLQIQASELFNLLTAGEYEGIVLDPETYELSIVDAGVPYLSTRFSGSEVDLANLAVRVAISEQVRFQAGGQVGLLVLDEALASLDTDRKDRLLGALTQLSGRFRQILVVTHAPEVKERLPRAVEVVKLPGRRATARVVEVGGGP